MPPEFDATDPRSAYVGRASSTRVSKRPTPPDNLDQLISEPGIDTAQGLADEIASLSRDTAAVHPALVVAALAARDDLLAAALASALRAHQADAWRRRRQLRLILLGLLGARPDLRPPIGQAEAPADNAGASSEPWRADLIWLSAGRPALARYGVELDVHVEHRTWSAHLRASPSGAHRATVELPAWWPRCDPCPARSGSEARPRRSSPPLTVTP